MSDLMKRKARFPRRVQHMWKLIVYSMMDLLHDPSVMGLPPHKMMGLAGSDSCDDFMRVGQEFLQYFIGLACLSPHERILDVGCGVGRMAIPLTGYLNGNSSYDGFDIVKREIEWCKRKITSNYPNFHFTLADIFNAYYNPHGRFKDSEYVFPFGSSYFDFIFVTSVFTHMLPEGVRNYLSEVGRVLKDGGRCLVSLFLLNDETKGLNRSKESGRDFRSDFGIYRAESSLRETALAYDEEFIRTIFMESKLRIRDPVFYGSWSGRSSHLSYQDIIIAFKG